MKQAIIRQKNRQKQASALPVLRVLAGRPGERQKVSRLVYERDRVDANIWRVPGPNSSDKKTFWNYGAASPGSTLPEEAEF